MVESGVGGSHNEEVELLDEELLVFVVSLAEGL